MTSKIPPPPGPFASSASLGSPEAAAPAAPPKPKLVSNIPPPPGPFAASTPAPKPAPVEEPSPLQDRLNRWRTPPPKKQQSTIAQTLGVGGLVLCALIVAACVVAAIVFFG